MTARGWHYPRVVAHRGGGTQAPENTLAGMRAAFERGLLGVEFDAMLAGDGVPVLMHDPQLGRTVAGHGAISSLDARELTTRDAGAWLHGRFRGETVPMLADTVRWLRAAGIWANIEIKPVPGYEVETGRVVGEVSAQLYAEPRPAPLNSAIDWRRPELAPLFSSFSYEALAAAREAAPHMARALLFSRIPDDWQEQLQSLDCVALHCNHQSLTPALAASIKAAGYGLFCYTVNEPARARELLSWGVDAFCTDRIDLFDADFS